MAPLHSKVLIYFGKKIPSKLFSTYFSILGDDFWTFWSFSKTFLVTERKRFFYLRTYVNKCE
jgi:hypothetical protein